MHHGSSGHLSGSVFCRPRSPQFLAVFTKKLFTSGVYLSQSSEVSNVAMLLFGGTVTTVDSPQQEVMLTMHEGFVKFVSNQRSANVVVQARSGIERLLTAKLDNPEVDTAHAAAPLIEAVLALLRWEERDGGGLPLAQQQTTKQSQVKLHARKKGGKK